MAAKVLERQAPEATTQATPEEVAKEIELSKDGSKNILQVAIDYCKKYNGYPYISCSRIEKIIDPKKGEKGSFLFDQLSVNFMAKNVGSGVEDFMETFGNGRLVFIQAHASCPTLAADGLYNAMDLNGQYIKTQLAGYFAISEPPTEETTDEVSLPEYEYYYKDANEQFMGLQVNDDTPLAEYYKKHTTLYRRLKKPNFEPFIVVKQGPDKFGKIPGNPFPTMPTAVAATLLKKATLSETPTSPAEEK